MRKAYDYCVSTDEDGDGLMDNTKAGLAAVETGTLRSRDVLTDVFLASAWTEAAAAAADLARIADPAFAATAQAAADKARASLNCRFLDDGGRRIDFAVMKDGTGQAEPTVWPAFGIWRGVFDRDRPAVDGTLDELARAGLGTDWGARMLSKESRLYAPLSYNNGASWPFLTGWAALALYKGGRPDAAWHYLESLSELTFLEGRGYLPELLSGDLLRSVDAAVPHQLFATTGFVSGVMRGMVGFEEGDRGLRLTPHLPPGWEFLRVKNIRWRGARGDLEVRRDAGGTVSAKFVERARGPMAVSVVQPKVAGPTIALVPEEAPLRLGDAPQRLRIIETRTDDSRSVYTARLQGLQGRTYRVRLDVPFSAPLVVRSIEGGREVGRDGRTRIIDITVPDGATEWVDCALTVRIGPRTK